MQNVFICSTKSVCLQQKMCLSLAINTLVKNGGKKPCPNSVFFRSQDVVRLITQWVINHKRTNLYEEEIYAITHTQFLPLPAIFSSSKDKSIREALTTQANSAVQEEFERVTIAPRKKQSNTRPLVTSIGLALVNMPPKIAIMLPWNVWCFQTCLTLVKAQCASTRWNTCTFPSFVKNDEGCKYRVFCSVFQSWLLFSNSLYEIHLDTFSINFFPP